MEQNEFMAFKGHYIPGFQSQEAVQETISHWNLNHQHFSMRTSGSTGIPKEVQLSRELLIWSSENTWNVLGLDNEHTFCCLPVERTAGFMQLIRSLHHGSEITFTEPHGNPMIDIDTSTFTFTSLTPSQCQHILHENEEKLAPFRNVIVGGAHVYDDLIADISRFNERHPEVMFWESFGMTETASHIAMKNLSKGETFFTPNPGVEISTVQGNLAIDIPELELHFETTDLAVIKDGKFKVMGRMDDVINSGGIKIHPAVLEPQIKGLLKEMHINRPLYITSKSDPELGEKAVLVMEGTPITDSDFILETLKRELPAYHAPKEIVFVDLIHITRTGKVIRKVVE